VSSDLVRPRRSVLYMPGANERALEKAKGLPADAIIFDLEDATAPDAKESARDAVCAAVTSGEYGRRELTIRVNGLDTQWHADDVRAAAAAGPSAVVVPKVSSAADVHAAEKGLEAAGAPDHTMIWAMVETPVAMLHAEEIASASERIACIVMATSDLLNQLHGRRTPDRIALLYSLSHVLLAGRANDRAVVDGISTDLKDMQSFEYACRLGRDLGFDGKTLVHPFQLPYCNDAFTPKPFDISAAIEVIDALDNAHHAGRGTVVVNGRLIEGHHVKAAKRMLALADMIEKLEAGQ